MLSTSKQLEEYPIIQETFKEFRYMATFFFTEREFGGNLLFVLYIGVEDRHILKDMQ